jgi:hypothetical protein
MRVLIVVTVVSLSAVLVSECSTHNVSHALTHHFCSAVAHVRLTVHLVTSPIRAIVLIIFNVTQLVDVEVVLRVGSAISVCLSTVVLLPVPTLMHYPLHL